MQPLVRNSAARALLDQLLEEHRLELDHPQAWQRRSRRFLQSSQNDNNLHFSTTEIGDPIPAGSPPPRYSTSQSTSHNTLRQRRVFSASTTVPANANQYFQAGLQDLIDPSIHFNADPSRRRDTGHQILVHSNQTNRHSFGRTIGAGRPVSLGSSEQNSLHILSAGRPVPSGPPPTYNHFRFTRALESNVTFLPSSRTSS